MVPDLGRKGMTFTHPWDWYMGVSKNRGIPKMDGGNNGNPYENG